jgi:hypothetical protein
MFKPYLRNELINASVSDNDNICLHFLHHILWLESKFEFGSIKKFRISSDSDPQHWILLY